MADFQAMTLSGQSVNSIFLLIFWEHTSGRVTAEAGSTSYETIRMIQTRMMVAWMAALELVKVVKVWINLVYVMIRIAGRNTVECEGKMEVKNGSKVFCPEQPEECSHL